MFLRPNRPRSANRLAAPRFAGLTLMEMLVVLALLALLSAMLLQGLGAFADRYQTVQRLHRQGAQDALRAHWFASSVRGLVPVGVEAKRFRGAATGFEGTTLRPLAAESGMPARVRWAVGGGSRKSVTYAEDGAPAWRILATDRPALAFEYGDSKGEWHREWPVFGARNEWLPRMIRLASGDAPLWMASVEATPQPIIDEWTLRR